MAKHWKNEKKLVHRKRFLIEELELVRKKYGEKMSELWTEIETTKKIYRREKVEIFIDVEKRYKSSKATFDMILTERERDFRSEKNGHLIQIRRNLAAAKIQNWWRAYRVRKLSIMKKKLKRKATIRSTKTLSSIATMINGFNMFDDDFTKTTPTLSNTLTGNTLTSRNSKTIIPAELPTEVFGDVKP
ncbi:hypothetical protein HELRODRAFT_175707 [Helobdella robusta]|uniref:Uncharacterized protein n=1 Tax=Helobdella robusta TaxID=6412 RepID=T1F9J8_HELRO|nr:hypothetical protein HELRODRAFT_175707 [Helobdella robusta]ESO00718.1 hypothetical protein HELRODRAFT_175707 [Helobdella robusta]